MANRRRTLWVPDRAACSHCLGRRSVRCEQVPPLISPIGWHIVHERLERHMGRVPALQYGLRDVGRKKSYLDDSAHIPPMEAGFGCDRPLMKHFSPRDATDPIMGTSYCFDKG